MNTFEIVTIVVSAAGIVLGLRSYLGIGATLEGLGRTGWTWIDHEKDLPLADQPSEDGPDLPLPKRVLRGRPE